MKITHLPINNNEYRFAHVNQYDETITSMLCTVYASFINMKYNGVIDSFTEDDIKEVARRQHIKGLLSYTTGAKGIDSLQAVISYVKEKYNAECIVFETTEDEEAKSIMNKGWACLLGIKVNAGFYPDASDGKIDTIDYTKLKGDMGHFTNLIKWIKEGEQFGKEYILDSYFLYSEKRKGSTYELSIDKFLSTNLDMITKYFILPKKD